MGPNSFLMSLPAYNRMANPFRSVDDLRYAKIAIKFKNPEDTAAVQTFVANAKAQFTPDQANSITFRNFYEDTQTYTQVKAILDIIFSVIIVITMILCLFSLTSSMSANLLEQTKEIGVLRAMGFTKFRIKILYFYEAVILVMASSLLGIMIGSIVGYTMTLQQAVFTSTPLEFFFPTFQFGIIMGMSLLCAFIATWGPSSDVVKHEISEVFRMGA